MNDAVWIIERMRKRRRNKMRMQWRNEVKEITPSIDVLAFHPMDRHIVFLFDVFYKYTMVIHTKTRAIP